MRTLCLQSSEHCAYTAGIEQEPAMTRITKGQIVTLKPEWLEPGETNLPHIALEDSCRGTVRVIVAVDVGLPIPPINDWRVEWIADESR
jgi:hypothetical protein